MHGLGTYCLSVIHCLVLTPSQTQRCQYCFYNAPSSQGLILYFTVEEKKKKKPHFLHQNVSCFCLTQTAPCLAVQFTCPTAMRAVVPLRFRQGTEHSSLGGQAYIDVVLVIHNHTGMRQDPNYGMSCMDIVGKRACSL